MKMFGCAVFCSEPHGSDVGTVWERIVGLEIEMTGDCISEKYRKMQKK